MLLPNVPEPRRAKAHRRSSQAVDKRIGAGEPQLDRTSGRKAGQAERISLLASAQQGCLHDLKACTRRYLRTHVATRCSIRRGCELRVRLHRKLARTGGMIRALSQHFNGFVSGERRHLSNRALFHQRRNAAIDLRSGLISAALRGRKASAIVAATWLRVFGMVVLPPTAGDPGRGALICNCWFWARMIPGTV